MTIWAYNSKRGNVVSVGTLRLAEEALRSKNFASDSSERRSAMKDFHGSILSDGRSTILFNIKSCL